MVRQANLNVACLKGVIHGTNFVAAALRLQRPTLEMEGSIKLNVTTSSAQFHQRMPGNSVALHQHKLCYTW